MRYRVTKTYGHERGFSATFRQHHATSHCRFLHGYALAFAITFEAEVLDEHGWVIDFGSLGPIKDWLASTFDHKTLVAADDPEITAFRAWHDDGILDMVEVRATGCEAFARLAFERVNGWLHETGQRARVRLAEVTVMEHGSNAATVIPDYEQAH